MELQAYHYTECGLDNVYLYNIPQLTDCGSNDVVYIPRINQLHRVITIALLKKQGLLSAKEIRFIRTYLELRQARLAEELGKDAQTVGRWERGEHPIDITADRLLRVVAMNHMGLLKDFELNKIFNLSGLPAANDNINIDGSNDYILMDAA